MENLSELHCLIGVKLEVLLRIVSDCYFWKSNCLELVELQ